MTVITLTLQNHSSRTVEIDEGKQVLEIIKTHLPGEAKKALAADLDGTIIDLSAPLSKDGTLKIITADSKEGLEIMRHSTSHVMAAAVKHLFPDVKVTIGPSIDNGFYYDFERSTPFVPEDLVKIEKEMERIISRNEPFVRKVMQRDEAMKFFRERGEDYKVEIISDLPAETVSLYETGDFIDLCTGPHIPSTSKIRVFKLLSIAGAYWRGDEKRQMLQRIYGTAFEDKKKLEEYLHALEEAKKRDHRRLGKDLDLFSFYEEGGPGLVYWHPRGGFIRKIIEDFWKDEHLKRGYDLINTPHIAKIDLWKKSGHWDFYRENMYSPIDIEGQEYILKPMNCPFHILIYNSRLKSYRELPVRYAELGTVYRYERSGVLHGTLRVRGFTQDDAHIFCTPEQLEEEMIKCVEFARFMMETFGFREYEVNLATRPEKIAGKPEDWDRAESILAHALTAMGIPYVVDEGGAVFYGPKIDIKIKDALGRLWQGPTVQFDFNLPGRFEVTYKGSDGKEHYVYMVHRALLGSLERFMGCLVEHYAGAFPVWLSPVQAVIMPITERNSEYAAEVKNLLTSQGIRVEIDDRNEKINLKIREAQLQKTPYMVILGDKEVEERLLSVRERKAGNLGSMTSGTFLEKIREDIAMKR
ncbi:MAG: threonine--tRNA ligase [Candidatus Eremiobacteraeota bacterium]|nr:threonine--tRNA ligase [Candidatus Eremiobacteraeota bacterium]